VAFLNRVAPSAATAVELRSVTTELARHRVVAIDLRLEQATLEDAFVALSGRTAEN
jgi:ABC-2 type transport system ATP-binding protein